MTQAMLSMSADSGLTTAGHLRVAAAAGCETVCITPGLARAIAAQLDAGDALQAAGGQMIAELDALNRQLEVHRRMARRRAGLVAALLGITFGSVASALVLAVTG